MRGPRTSPPAPARPLSSKRTSRSRAEPRLALGRSSPAASERPTPRTTRTRPRPAPRRARTPHTAHSRRRTASTGPRAPEPASPQAGHAGPSPYGQPTRWGLTPARPPRGSAGHAGLARRPAAPARASRPSRPRPAPPAKRRSASYCSVSGLSLFKAGPTISAIAAWSSPSWARSAGRRHRPSGGSPTPSQRTPRSSSGSSRPILAPEHHLVAGALVQIRDRRTPDRPERQDPAARGRPPERRGGRRAIAPFAELERAPEHVHTYRITPLGLWNARAAGHDAEQVVDALITHSRYAVAACPARRRRRRRWTGTAGCTLEKDRDARPGAAHARTGRCSRRCCGTSGSAAGRRAPRRPRPSSCTRASAATSSRSCSRSAGRPRTSPVTSTARRTPSTSTRTAGSCGPYQQQAVDGFWHGGSGVVVLPCGAGKTLVGAGAMAGRRRRRSSSSPTPCAPGSGSDELLKRTTPDRGRDRRVLRRPQGDPARHDRDLPGADDPPEGRLHPPRPARRPRLGPHRLRRGAPAAGADLPDDRRPAGPPPPRPHRDPGARGRPRGRRLQPHRPEALRRAVEGHRGPGLHRARRLRRGAGHAAGRPSGWRTPWPSPRTATAWRRAPDAKIAVVEDLVEQHRGEPTLVIGQYLDQLDELAEPRSAPT